MDQQRPEGRQRGLRLFQRKMERRENVPGTSLSAIQSYLRGVEPTRPFIEAAAEVLAVRPAWLAFGDGAQTAAEEAARREERVRPEWERVAVEEFAAHLPWDSMSPASRAHAWVVWGLVLDDLPGKLPDHASAFAAEWFGRDAAHRAARALTAPADALGVALPHTPRELNSYIALVAEGLLALLYSPEEE
jgi:transcriptional regulator with XRE-family HTH domain